MTDSTVVRFFHDRLVGADMERVEEHLASCSTCARVVAEAAIETGPQGATWSDRLRPGIVVPGTLVAGRYLIRRSLGVGAMGEVHEAEDRLLNKVVALKTLNAALTGRPGAIDRLKSEVVTAHRVTHPNVNRVFDLGLDQQATPEGAGTFVFLTMEYLAGETVSALLRRRKGLPAKEALPLLCQIAAGLAAAHDVGVIHRDLKAENVMLVSQPDGNLRAVITDFGLAGMITDLSAAPEIRGFSGTVAYAAPERLAGRRATPASDVYSFGLLAQQILTGTLPPTASTAVVAAALRLGERLGPVSLETRGRGPAWDRFVLRTLHPIAAQRYASGAEVLEALRSMRMAPGTFRPRRWPVTMGVAGAAMLAAAVWATKRSGSPPASSPHSVAVPSTAYRESSPPRVPEAPPPAHEPIVAKTTREGVRRRLKMLGPTSRFAPAPSRERPRSDRVEEGDPTDIVRQLRDVSMNVRSPEDLASDLADPFKPSLRSGEEPRQ